MFRIFRRCIVTDEALASIAADLLEMACRSELVSALHAARIARLEARRG